MGYIHSIQAGQNRYLIEPYLYAEATGNSIGYEVLLDEYTTTPNTILFIKVPTINSRGITLRVNNGSTIPIYYQNSEIPTGTLKAGYTYALTYNNNRWNILNNLSQGDGGVTILDEEGGLENGPDGLRIQEAGISNSMIADATIENEKLVFPYITIGGQDVYLGGSLDVSDLGITGVLHFKGIAKNNSLQEGSHLDPLSTSTPIPNYAGEPGDVIIDIDQEYEYVWIDETSGWERLGGNDTYKVIQTPVSDPQANGSDDSFIATIEQNANGNISVTKKYVSSWQYDRKVYADLSNASQNVTINGASANAAAVGIGIDGILGINNGGIGADGTDWQEGGILYGVQERDNKYYTSLAGSQYQILTSGGTGAPVWATAALLSSTVNNIANQNNYTILELGNDVDKTDITSGHSEGIIILYSAGTEAHILTGESTSISYTHILPNSNGYILQAESINAVGSNTQPVYIAEHGIATALTYTPNRLYYSDNAVSDQSYATDFIAGNYYANGTQLGINITDWPSVSNTPITDTLYVEGATTITGILNITDNTDITNNSNGALILAGGATINKKLYVGNTLTVENNSTLNGHVGIGAEPTLNNMLYVDGTSLFNGNLIPETNNSVQSPHSLGTPDHHWTALYIGPEEQYGDPYTPVYWNNGVPIATSPTQYADFTIANNQTYVDIVKSDIYNINTIVLEIVVTSGISYLNGPIDWTNNTNTIRLTTTQRTSGAVSGYIVTARGEDLNI